jgi:hypothetical protein
MCLTPLVNCGITLVFKFQAVWTTSYHTQFRLLAQGRWFSPGTPASSTTKTGRHDIAEILLKVAVETPQNNH